MSIVGGSLGARAHQAQRVDLSVTRTATGYLLESPTLPGWSRHVHSLTTLRDGIGAAFVEAEIAAYARFRGTLYDAADHQGDAFDAPPPPAPPPPERRHPSEPPPPTEIPRAGYSQDAVHRPDCHDPAEWTPLPDGSGRWRSPGGLTYGPHTSMVASITTRRSLLGLPTGA